MKCRECDTEMVLDDKDFNFEGNYDNYWICPHCPVSCVEQVRFGQSFKEKWYSEVGGLLSDFEIKKSIKRI